MTTQMTARIEAVLATAPTWTAARRKSDGKAFFFIPSATSAAVYMADATGCTCPAAQRYSGPCKHSLAVAAHLAAKVQPARRPRLVLAPICAADGCEDDTSGGSGFCWHHVALIAA